MGLDKLKKSELNAWRKAYAKNIHDPNETLSGLISLMELKQLITYIDYYNLNTPKPDQCDGIRIYLVRSGLNKHLPVMLPNKITTSQISFAIVPTKNYGQRTE